MSVTAAGVNLAFHLHASYIEAVVLRLLIENGSPCWDTGGTAVDTGAGFLRATDAIVRYDAARTIVDAQGAIGVVVEVAVVSGSLEVGDDPSQMAGAQAASFTFPLTVDARSTRPTLLELSVDVGLPTQSRLTFGVFDVADLDQPGLSFELRADPARLKLLSDGNLALGVLLQNSTSVGFNGFLAGYDDSRIGPGGDWALALDEWTVGRIVATMEIDQDNLRNVALSLEDITAGGLDIEATGQAQVGNGWFGFCADVSAELTVQDPDTTASEIWVHYEIIRARTAGCTTNVTGRIPPEDREGDLLFRDPGFFGEESDPAGRFFALEAGTEADEIVIEGVGTRVRPQPAVLQVTPDELVFAPTCAGDPTERAVVVGNPGDPATQAPLTICRLDLTGSGHFDASTNVTPLRIAAGATATLDVTYTGPVGAPESGTLTIASDAGSRDVTLDAHLGTGVIEAPDSVSLEGEQRLLDCLSLTIDRAEQTFDVANRGDGAAEVCTIEFRNETGGSWTLSGLRAGNLILPGEVVEVTLRYTADDLDAEHTADLRIETSGGTVSIALDAIVHAKDADDEVSPPEEINGIHVGSIVTGSDQICLEAEDLDRLINAWPTLLDILSGDGPSLWGRITPLCCPPPVQPYCLCHEFVELRLIAKEAVDLTVTAQDADGTERARHAGMDREHIALIPLTSGEAPPRIALSGEGSSGRVSGRIRRWSMNRVGRWESEEPVAGLASFGSSVVTLSGQGLKGFGLAADGHPSVRWEAPAPRDARWLVARDRYLLYGGVDGYEAARVGKDGVSAEENVGTGWKLLVPFFASGRELAVGVNGEGTLEALRTDAPTALRAFAKAEIGFSPHAACQIDDGVLLAGEDRIEVWSLSRSRFERVARFEQKGVTSVTGLGDRALAFHGGGSVTAFQSRAGEVRQTDSLTLPRDWYDSAPHGPFALLGDRFASLRADRMGFNVFEMTRGSAGVHRSGAGETAS